MRFFHKPVLLILFILFISCDENDIENTVLFTYETNNPVENELLLLTDSEGNLLDSASSANQSIITLEGPAGTKDYTFTIVRTTIYGSIYIYSYFHTNASGQKNNYIYDSENSRTYVNLNIGDDLQHFHVSGRYDYFESQILEDSEVEASLENRVSILRNMWPSANQFAIYDNLKNNDNVNVSLDDFTDMTYYSVDEMSNLSVTLYGRSSQSRYYLGNYYSNSSSGIYYPKGLFDNYSWIVKFDKEDQSQSSTFTNQFYGDLTDIEGSLTKLEFNTLDLPKSIKDYKSGCDNSNVDVVLNSFYDDGYLHVMYIYGPNNSELKLSPLIDLINSIYPDNEITLSHLGGTSLYEYVDITYDQFVTRSTQLNSFKRYQENQP